MICLYFFTLDLDFPENLAHIIRFAYVSSMAHLDFIKILCSDFPHIITLTRQLTNLFISHLGAQYLGRGAQALCSAARFLVAMVGLP